jgi:hypothetical protein
MHLKDQRGGVACCETAALPSAGAVGAMEAPVGATADAPLRPSQPAEATAHVIKPRCGRTRGVPLRRRPAARATMPLAGAVFRVHRRSTFGNQDPTSLSQQIVMRDHDVRRSSTGQPIERTPPTVGNSLQLCETPQARRLFIERTTDDQRECHMDCATAFYRAGRHYEAEISRSLIEAP